MPHRPLVTVGLPVHDGEDHLEAALDSLQAQTLDDLEIVVADNASTDRTLDIVRDRAGSDPRVRLLVSDENRGAAWNYNRLVHVARGRFFTWAAHDDLREPTCIEQCVGALDAGPADVVLAYPRTIIIGEHDEVLDADFVDGLDFPEPTAHERLARYSRHRGEQHAVFGVVRTAVLRRTRLIARCWGGDIPLLAELLLAGRFRELPDRLFRRRYHPATSMLAHGSDTAAVVRWFDPSAGRRRPWPRTRLLLEVTGRITCAPLPAGERARCVGAFTSGWLVTYGRHMGGEAKLALRDALAPHRRGAPGRYQSV